jgi:formate dehydrogenase subunit gamma
MVTLEPVYCLGNCACSPSIRINDDIHARVNESRFDQLISELTMPDADNTGVSS